uniref:Uncharacterized protein n=1 Tax=Anguilla anguilla TaxID=7936 RepID=A0A0E9WGK6_ANGAN
MLTLNLKIEPALIWHSAANCTYITCAEFTCSFTCTKGVFRLSPVLELLVCFTCNKVTSSKTFSNLLH